MGFIKADRTKHINPHIFTYSQDLVDKGQFEIRKIKSENNIDDMLTKALFAYKHKKLISAAYMKSLHELNQLWVTFFLLWFYPIGFFIINILTKSSQVEEECCSWNANSTTSRLPSAVIKCRQILIS